jgi:hypothetical protein
MAKISDLLTSSLLSTVSLSVYLYIICSQIHLIIAICRGRGSIMNW